MFGLEPGLTVVLIALVALGVYNQIRKIKADSMPMFCPNCGTQASPISKIRGSFAIEIVLWICFIIPGLIYSLWRRGNMQKACPACDQPNMIPLDSPKAQSMLGR